MSTRSNTFVIDRQEAELYVAGFAVKPSIIADKSYVNMYMHHDGYIDFIGVELAQWVNHMQEGKWNEHNYDYKTGTAGVAAELVKDFHYNSQYLYPTSYKLDTDYTYIIWTGKSDVWISQYDNTKEKCSFVGSVNQLIKKHKKDDMNYTEWHNEEYASKGY